MKRSVPVSSQQGSMFEQLGPVSIETPGLHFGPAELGSGVFESDSTDISTYLPLYVDAIRQIGRGRSNDIGFGSLYSNSAPVREVAYQHDNPDRAEVQRTVVDSRVTHMKRANDILVKRANFRESNARKWQAKGTLTTEDISKIPLLEDAAMLEGKWYGKPNEASSKDAAKARELLYRIQSRYKKSVENSNKAA